MEKTTRGKMRFAGVLSAAIAIALFALCLTGCGGDTKEEGTTFVYGTTGYGVEMNDAGLNPHEDYSGWSAVRYGVGETLFKFSDSMEPEPWLATSYEFTDKKTCVVKLREDVDFTSGRHMDAQAVKECLDDLIAVHDRAPSDTKISSIEADGYTLTIHTSEPCPALINFLCDPYGAIIDMQAGVSADKNVAGTGPYRATAVSDTEITLEKNTSYWGGEPKVDSIVVKSITDGDTLTSALQSGEIDAAYGLPYASYELFGDESAYRINSCETSRVFFGEMNYRSEIMQDEAVREAISLGIDKEGFVDALLNGRGAATEGAYPASFEFGTQTVKGEGYDPEKAKALLEEAGWVDEDGDGIREKDGQRLTIRWLTYPGRQELPLLAESAQSTLKDIGFDVWVNSTANHTEIRKDPTAWDVYASAVVTAPTGDPEYFFAATCLEGASQNFGGYKSAQLEKLAAKLHAEFDPAERARLGTEMQQVILDDHGYFFASHLTMGIVARAGVEGMVAHPCDYYEITVDLAVD